MSTNIIKVVFTVLFFITAIAGFLFRIADALVPQIMVLSNRYEKYTYFITEHIFISRIEVPETWFRSFFKFPVTASTLAFVLAFSRYILLIDLPEGFYYVFDKLLGDDRQALVNPETTLLALTMLTIQCSQRFFEAHYITYFTDDKTKEFSNYIFSYIHYGVLIICLIGESEGFVRGSKSEFEWSDLTNGQRIGAIIFILASSHQLRTSFMMANSIDMAIAAKRCINEVVLPRGGLYELVSGAPEFTEALMYLMMSIIMKDALTYHYVFLWILANEVTMATFSHTYHRTYCRDFPRNRKAFIPFVY